MELLRVQFASSYTVEKVATSLLCAIMLGYETFVVACIYTDHLRVLFDYPSRLFSQLRVYIESMEERALLLSLFENYTTLEEQP